jgi:hypothetical protein
MDRLPCRHVRSACLVAGHVGAGCGLGLRPKGVVLGHSDPEVHRVVDGLGADLADAVGEAVAETGDGLDCPSQFPCTEPDLEWLKGTEPEGE